MQSGIALNLHIANLATDGTIIQLARNAAEDLLDSDPTLCTQANNRIARELHTLFDRRIDLSHIS